MPSRASRSRSATARSASGSVADSSTTATWPRFASNAEPEKLAISVWPALV